MDLSFLILSRIRQNNRFLDQLVASLQTGKSFFMSDYSSRAI
jgi:hypothetical protein